MKKMLSLFAVAALFSTTASAQGPLTKELGIFNHLSAGIELGTTGVGVEVASPVTRFVTVRTGVTFLPTISYSTDIDYETNKNLDRTTNIEAKLHMTDWKLLADVYPFVASSFHVTAGFYVGKSKLITAQNTTPITVGYGPNDDLMPGEGMEVGNYLVTPDANGIIRANVKVGGFKPYVGIGFGRPVAKSRKLVTCAFDLGVQFWGKPSLNAWATDDNRWVEVTKADIDDDDFEDAYDIVRKIVVYPVLNFRLYFNAF